MEGEKEKKNLFYFLIQGLTMLRKSQNLEWRTKEIVITNHFLLVMIFTIGFDLQETNKNALPYIAINSYFKPLIALASLYRRSG